MNRQHATQRLASTTTRFASSFPQYFALVMATAVIATSARQLGYDLIGWALFAATVLEYPLCWLAGATRLMREPMTVLGETTHHSQGPQFLTIVAGTGLMGGMLATFRVASWALPGLFAAAVVLWVGFVYAFLAGVTEGRHKPPLEQGISGTWLLVSVATASLTVIGSSLMQQLGAQPEGLGYFCYIWVLVAILYYALMGAVVLYRFAFVPMPPDEIAGPWWINAGAATTTQLAGTKLMALGGLHIGRYTADALLSPWMFLLWADATFWIPLLVVLFAWKYLVRRRKLQYAPALWSIVFPLGSYAAATFQSGTTYGIDFLHGVAEGFFWVALVAWALGIVGLLVTIAKTLVQTGTPVQTK